MNEYDLLGGSLFIFNFRTLCCFNELRGISCCINHSIELLKIIKLIAEMMKKDDRMFVCVLWLHTFLAGRTENQRCWCCAASSLQAVTTITIITIILKCSLWSTVLPWSCGPGLPWWWERRESLTCLSHIPRYSWAQPSQTKHYHCSVPIWLGRNQHQPAQPVSGSVCQWHHPSPHQLGVSNNLLVSAFALRSHRVILSIIRNVNRKLRVKQLTFLMMTPLHSLHTPWLPSQNLLHLSLSLSLCW